MRQVYVFESVLFYARYIFKKYERIVMNFEVQGVQPVASLSARNELGLLVIRSCDFRSLRPKIGFLVPGKNLQISGGIGAFRRPGHVTSGRS